MKKRTFSAIKLLLVLLAVGVLCWSALPGGEAFWKRALSFIGVESPFAPAENAAFAVYFLPVGKADAILIQADGEYMLVDGGTPGQAETVIEFLWQRGVKKLHTVLSTHPDKDHYGGLRRVLEQFAVGQYVYAAVPEELLPQEDEYLGLQQTLTERHITQVPVHTGDRFSVKGLNVFIAAPATAYADTNTCSVVAKLQYGEISVLLTGDASALSEQDMLHGDFSLQADILKVSHHGSKSASCAEFLAAVQPQYAVVSVGENTSGLPHSQTLLRLQQCGATVYRTDLDGTVTFYGDGKVLWCMTDTVKPHRVQ